MSNCTSKDIEDLYLNHYREWCLISYSYVEDMAQAEDVVQDVLEKVLCKMDKENNILNLKSYIFIAIRNSSLKYIKKTKKVVRILETEILTHSHEEVLIDTEKRASILEALCSLPEQSKRVFELCVLDGMKYDVAADTLNISTNTVKYHIKKGYKTLRFLLQNHYSVTLIAAILTNFFNIK